MEKTINKNRLVIKVGTSTLAHSSGRLNLRRVEQLVRVISELKNMHKHVVLVTSGAISVGTNRMGLAERPIPMRQKQAIAAIGQCELMNIYGRMFSDYGNNVAQLLVTRDAFDNGVRQQNISNTIESLFEYGAIPIVNENDSVSFEEIEFGDNDTLSAMIASMISAHMLIILSDIDGLFDKDPHKDPSAEIIHVVEKIDKKIYDIAGGAGSKHGTGGMVTKIRAAEIAHEAGCSTVITNGSNPQNIYRIIDGENVGTIIK